MISGNKPYGAVSLAYLYYRFSVLTLQEQGLEKKAFILCAKDIQILCCSYFQVVFKKKPVLLLNYSNSYLRRTTKPTEGSGLRPQSAEVDVALLMAPTPLQTSDLPRSAFTLSPEPLQPQCNTARKADEALLPRKRAHFLLRTTTPLPTDTSDACHFLPVPFDCYLTGLCPMGFISIAFALK